MLIESVADGTLHGHAVQSRAAVLRVLAGSSMGIRLGVVMGLHRPTADTLEPLVSFLNALSGIAWTAGHVRSGSVGEEWPP